MSHGHRVGALPADFRARQERAAEGRGSPFRRTRREPIPTAAKNNTTRGCSMLAWIPEGWDGWATLIATFIGLVAVYVQYELNKRNRRIRLATALIAEIETSYELQTHELRREKENVISKIKDGTEKFTAWGGRENYPIYDNVSSDLLLLPEDTLKEIVQFYLRDSELQSMITNMSSDTFHNLSVDRKMRYANELFNNMDNEYTMSKDNAVRQLSRIITRRRYPY
jgi:hypothetical protein